LFLAACNALFIVWPVAMIYRFGESPYWERRRARAARLAAAHTLPREMRAEERYTFDTQRFADLRTPTLLLAGTESPDFFMKGIEVVNAALPNSRIVVMPGQGHIAMDTAPDLFLREVLSFLSGPS
jgi:pimeloyl-ACP methyl ester carboxylesterase